MRTFESPSSINLYYQCPRRYFYQYNLKLPTKKSIHLVRGAIVHTCCEKFYREDLPNYEKHRILNSMHNRATNIFAEEWRSSRELRHLNLDFAEIQKYLNESMGMMANFVRYNYKEMAGRAAKGVDFEKAWHKLKPVVEKEIFCRQFGVRGYIDVIQNGEGKTYGMPVIRLRILGATSQSATSRKGWRRGF